MNAVRQSCRPKHQVLTLKCYPKFQKGVQEVKPNASELSYLLYYASTRRSKLQKVGAFLEKRAARDVWRGKIGNVQVTLEILTALIEKLPRDLPLYARSVLTVIETVLRSNDVSMVEETIPTFETFCKHQDVAALAADPEYTKLYQDIIQMYASFASPEPILQSKTPLSAPVAIRWRKAGLQAIRSVVGSEALATGGARQLNDVVPVILENLYADGEDTLPALQQIAQQSEKGEREQAKRRRMSVATVQTVDTTTDGNPEASKTTADADKLAEAEVRALALRCLEPIFTTGSNRSQIRVATKLILQFISNRTWPRDADNEESGHPALTKGNWATSLMEMIAKSIPVQDRFIIVVTAMEMLVSSPVAEDKLEQQLILAAMIDWLLASSVNMIGLSVMDVLLGFLQHILLLLQLGGQDTKIAPHHQQTVDPAHHAKNIPDEASPEIENEKGASEKAQAKGGNTAPPSWVRQELLALLQKCIGDLATHIYYADQLADMIQAILSRLKPSPDAELSSSAADRQTDSSSPTAHSGSLQEDHSMGSFFSFATARIIALKAVKEILVVANLRKSVVGSGTESRNRVGIHVWDNTQWLLREPNREVRHAYANAFVTWLQLETTRSDMKVYSEGRKARTAKRDPSDAVDRMAKRTMSTRSQKEKRHRSTSSTFLLLLHLAIYDNALEYAEVVFDILLLHLLLVNLIEHLGVNAASAGLPMIMKLQEDVMSPNVLGSATAKVNVGSLVHGYLLALSEKFDFDTSKVGRDIHDEIRKRQRKGFWLEKIRLPPVGLDSAAAEIAGSDRQLGPTEPPTLCPYTNVFEIVSKVEEAYNNSVVSAPTSAPSSPSRSLTLPILSQSYPAPSSAKPAEEDHLPDQVKEQMLFRWSREACMEAVEKEKSKALSLSGSRTATSAMRTYLTANGTADGNGSPNGTASPSNTHRRTLHDRQVASAYGLVSAQPSYQRFSIPSIVDSPATPSSRESTVRVNELRRVLSTTNNARHSSPLRGQSDAAQDGRGDSSSSSSESMVSGAFSASDAGVSVADYAEKPRMSEDDTDKTPKASNIQLNNGVMDDQGEQSWGRNRPSDIPPVPPLPPSLAIPGGFPTDVSPLGTPGHSPIRSDRPSTAPGPNARARSASARRDPNKSSTRRSSRPDVPNQPTHLKKSSSTRSVRGQVYWYRDGAGDSESETYGRSSAASKGRSPSTRSIRSSPRVDVSKLLDGIVVSEERRNDDSASPEPASNLTALPSFPSVNGLAKKNVGIRKTSGGIGRPPY